MKKLLNNKKGSDYDGFVSNNKFFFYILLTIFVGALIAVFTILIVRNIGSKTLIDDSVDADFILARITNQCFVHVDELTNEVNQNVIDLFKINDNQLSTCFKADYQQAFTVIVKPIYEDDFIKTTAKIGNPYVSDVAFARYVLVVLESGEIKPGTIYYLP